MTARVAVTAARYGDPWDELAVMAARTAGALAADADVDILVPSPRASTVEIGWDGACRLLRFPGTAVDRRRRAAWRLSALGSADAEDRPTCTPPTVAPRPLPSMVEEELVLAEGGDAPTLYDHLRATPYDATVFVGLQSPVACFGIRVLPEDRPVFLVPGAIGATPALRIHEFCLGRAERILVCTETERRQVVGRLGGERPDRVQDTGFVVGVNTVVQPEARQKDEEQFVVIARDWRRQPFASQHDWTSRLARQLPAGVDLRLVGPGASNFDAGIPDTEARIDAWWWMSRALAVIDPAPHRVVGQEVLEALLFGVPVIVAADGDATREHAETGNCGLWYLVDDELVGAVRRLLDQDVSRLLGEQGRMYAAGRFGDTDRYVNRVAEAVLGSDRKRKPNCLRSWSRTAETPGRS